MNGLPLAGSERAILGGAVATGRADPGERLEVSVLLRRQNAEIFRNQVAQMAHQPASERRHLSRAEFASQFGALEADVSAVTNFARQHGLEVAGDYPERRTLVLAGTVAQFEDAFGLELSRYQHEGGSYRGRVGAIHIPAGLEGVIEAVLGLDNRPQAQAHFRRYPGQREQSAGANAKAPATTSYTPVQVANAYQFPAGAGAGQCVGIIELGGGFQSTDLADYFAALGLPTPAIVAVPVDGAANQPSGGADGPDGEVMLDLEVVGAVAPDARIAVYFAPNTDAGFVDAVTTAIHDTTNRPSILSISWGSAESGWTAQSTAALDAAFQAAIMLGITVCVASGDNGSRDGVKDGRDHVDFPSSSPHVLACGGTTLHASPSSVTSETVWNDGSSAGASGGGVSTLFPAPSWQTGLHVKHKSGHEAPLTMRGVPDVSGNADPETGYQVRVDGNDLVIGGTSAVAPLWAGLTARLNSRRGTPLGFLNPLLYGQPGLCSDIVKGNNGDFAAADGWDACTGLGSPNGTQLAKL